MRSFLAIFLFCASITLSAQHSLESYDTRQGLSNQQVNCIYQDSRGFIWIGTNFGLNFFTGTDFIHYYNIPSDTNSLPHNIIRTITEDKEHRLWIGTQKGVSCFDLLEKAIFEEDDKVFASLCAGASGYILKNTAPDKVLQAIREVADGGAFFTPSIAKKVLHNFQQQPERAEYIKLSEKEKEVLKHLVDGLSYKMIADKINLSFHTIHTHVKNIYEKLHVNNKGEAVAKAIKNRLI